MIIILIIVAIGLGVVTEPPRPVKKLEYVYLRQADGTYTEKIIFKKDN